MAPTLRLILPASGHDLPRDLLKFKRPRKEENWAILNGFFGPLRLESWQSLHGCVPFFQNEEIMSDPWCVSTCR